MILKLWQPKFKWLNDEQTTNKVDKKQGEQIIKKEKTVR